MVRIPDSGLVLVVFVIVRKDLGRLQDVEQLLVVHVVQFVEVVLRALDGRLALILVNICSLVGCVVEDLDEVGNRNLFEP